MVGCEVYNSCLQLDSAACDDVCACQSQVEEYCSGPLIKSFVVVMRDKLILFAVLALGAFVLARS